MLFGIDKKYIRFYSIHFNNILHNEQRASGGEFPEV